MAKRPTIALPDYAPDLSVLGTEVSEMISGVVPRADGYGPFRAMQSFSQALGSNCRGYTFARKSDGSIAVFAGTANGLFLLNNIDFTWIDVSKGGTPYSNLVATDNWQFVQFNDTVIAVQKNAPPQAFALSTDAAFSDLGGSPPAAAHIAVVNGFLVLTGLLSNPTRIQWCDLYGITTWTAGVGLADFQDLPDGGSVFGLSGGDAYGLIFQNDSIRSLIYAPGSAVTFQIVRISTQDTLFAQFSVINAGTKTFFLSAQGFKMVDAGGVPVPIGKERVDRTFFADVDTSALQLVIGATDPTATRVYWAYKSKAGQAGLFDKVLCFDWSIGSAGKWSVLPISGEFLAALAKPGLTLENLDSIAPGALAITDAVDNGAGLIRLTLSALASGPFDIHGQNFIVVQGVRGTEEANGSWPFTIIDATHIDLTGSAFANDYTGGGAIGGSLDALPFSLDSISVAAISQLSVFDSTHRLAFFDGLNIEAIVETPEQDEGDLVFISAVRPLTDCAAVKVSIGGRFDPQSAVVYGAESGIQVQGDTPQSIETRYARARLRMPAGSAWTYVRAVQPLAQAAGEL